MTTTIERRTDIHRPSSPDFDPSGYTCLGVFDTDPEDGDNRERGETVRWAVSQGYRFTSAHSGHQCGHCGAHLRYVALMLHEATGGMIYVGEQCLDNRFESDLTAAAFQRLRKTAKLNRERKAKAERVAAVLDEHPLLAKVQADPTAYGDFAADVLSKLQTYGELSDRQIEAVERVVTRFDERAAQRAARAGEPTVAVPEGAKQTVTGEIVKVDQRHNSYTGGTDWKITVLDDRGFKVWGSLPSGIRPNVISGGAPEIWGLKGQRCEFTADLTRGDRDPSFGFHKRPTKARLI